MITFRYTQPSGYDIIMTFIPSSDFKQLDINSMCSDQDGAIFSATIDIGHINLADQDKSKLDNLDAWAVPELVNDKYVKEVFDKVTRKQEAKKEEVKRDEVRAEQRQTGPPGYVPSTGGYNPFTGGGRGGEGRG